ncbi:unnamed protein product [Urochloa decumbens]
MPTIDATIGGTRAGNGTAANDGTCVGSPAVPIDVDAPSATAGEREAHGQENDNDIYNVWNYGFKVLLGSKCGFCGFSQQSGGKTRLRMHLARIPGDVKPCEKAPAHVKNAMKKAHDLGQLRRKENKEYKQSRDNRLLQEAGGNPRISVPIDEDEQVRLAKERSLRDLGGPSRGNSRIIAKESGQPRIDTAMRPAIIEQLGEAWAKWFHANDIAGRKADCPYFRVAMRLTQQLGETSRLFTGSDIDGRFLDANYQDVQQVVEELKRNWKQYGVTLMCDSWTGTTSMSIINFMVHCNGRLFFHKSINASAEIQNAEFLYKEIKKVIVDEIGHENVVQIVTDNGANYKKACGKLIEEYNKIVWQPCAAHTINLMLKDIGKFSEIDDVVSAARRIVKFFHSHNRLLDEMKRKIGGQLVRPNATRFGTVFMFLQSFWDRKDKFRQWMVSDEWKELDWNHEPEYKFVDDCLSSPCWWDQVKGVMDTLGPLYVVLRYADGDNGTVSGFMPRMMIALKELETCFGEGTQMFKRYMSHISKRVLYLYEDTLIVAAAVLDPVGHYQLHLCENYDYVKSLEETIERLADSIDSGLMALSQFQAFKSFSGKFGGPMARRAVGQISATEWWTLFGGEVKELQRYAIRIVSQCVSSSGCERNWSTFALVHTKVRNRIGYEKLEKLVYVRHNLKLRLKYDEMERVNHSQEEVDPCALLMDAALFDESNPIMEWLNSSSEDTFMSLEQMISRSRKRKMASAGKKNGKRGRICEDEDNFLDNESDNDRDTPPGSPSYSDSADDGDHLDSGEDGERDEFAAPTRCVEEQHGTENANNRMKRARKEKRKEGFVY